MTRIVSVSVTVGFVDHSAMLEPVSKLSVEEVVDRISRLNQGLRDFWTDAEGWAPIEAAQLLSKSRIDWQVSLSKCIRIWLTASADVDSDGRLILAWANLGALVEGSLKLYLSVWYRDYLQDADAVTRRGRIVHPDELQLEKLRQFLKKKQLWHESWDAWIEKMQHRRNAIHAYKDRDIGDWNEFFGDVRRYLVFLRYVNDRLPYPDWEVYAPREV